jgi:hypothetical protein
VVGITSIRLALIPEFLYSYINSEGRGILK